jgi:arylsulfatase A-like enzyme
MENPTNTNPPAKRNVILITVDQMRFPMNLPPDKSHQITPDQFVEQHMPKLWEHLWNPGVKFSNYYTAASDCTAARATIYTGLYAYQTYSMLTLITFPDLDIMPPYEPEQLLQPQLEHDFPTIGKLMQEAQIDTPYFGKWHLSYHVNDLDKYGFDSHVPAGDYVGYAGQGLHDDNTIAFDASEWLRQRVDPNNPDHDKPFFLSVNFVNPHDKQWFWGAMEADKFNDVYSQMPPPPVGETPPRPYTEFVGEAEPEPFYAPKIEDAITNWQDEAALASKPKAQRVVKQVFQYQMGGIYESDEANTYTPVKSPPDFNYACTPLYHAEPGQPCEKHKAIAPPHYWSKALDSYIECMHYVDGAIGTFMDRLPREVLETSIFVFTSDHGEYGSSHGLQGKGGTVYEEGIRVPLIVYDPTHNFTPSPGTRTQLCSSVDLLRMIVTMAHDGGTGWLTENPDYEQMYGGRCDLLPILGSASAPGRSYAMHTTDEFVPDAINYLHAPLHVIGQIHVDENGNKSKLGVYTRWEKHKGESHATVLNQPNDPEVTELEFYELNNDPDEMANKKSLPAATQALATLFGGSTHGLLYSELQAELPEKYKEAQARAYHALITYERLVNESELPTAQTTSPELAQRIADEAERRVAGVWTL